MALTTEEREQAELHATGALRVYDGLALQMKATEEDILKKIDAFKINFNVELRRLEAANKAKEDLTLEKDKEGVHLPETKPVPVKPFNEEIAEDSKAPAKKDKK